MGQIAWKTASSGNFSIGTNWVGDTPPGPGDGATIDASGSYTVTLDTSATVGSLSLEASAAALWLVQTSFTLSGDLGNTGQIHIDDQYAGGGGSVVTVGGTLTNSGTLIIGRGYDQLASAVAVSVASLANTGQISLTGGYTNLAATVTLDVHSNAGMGTTGATSGSMVLDGQAALVFDAGQIDTITAGTLLQFYGQSRVADAADVTTNSALTGLANVAGTLSLAGETLAVAGDLGNTGQIHIDDQYAGGGGSVVTVGGTLTNSGTVIIGRGYDQLASAVAVSVASLANTGQISLTGGYTNLAATVTLDVHSNAGMGTTGATSGSMVLDGQAALVFDAGQIGTITAGTLLQFYGQSRVADAADVTTNSALTGLAGVAGTLSLAGETLAVAGDLGNTGQIHIDDQYAGGGGSVVTLGGTLTNSGTLIIGRGYDQLASAVAVSVASLANTGQISLTGGYTNLAATVTLDVHSNAGMGTTGATSGSMVLDGQAALVFDAGQIDTITAGTLLQFYGQSRVADAADVTTNSALTGLANVAGTLSLAGETLAVAGDLGNTGQIHIDDQYAGGGGSVVTLGGTLTNSGTLIIGRGYDQLASAVAVSVASLANTGQISLTGGYTNLAATVTLDVHSNAGMGTTGATSGSMVLDGQAALVFDAGQIDTIAAGTLLQFYGQSRVADAADVTTNSALTGLANVAGTLSLAGETLAVAGGLGNTGQIHIDDQYAGGGGSVVTAGGTLTNSGTVIIGRGYDQLATDTRVTVGTLVNSANILVIGNPGTATATLAAIGAAGNSGSIDIDVGALLTVGGAFTETAGTLTLLGTVSAGSAVFSGGRLALAGGTFGAGQVTLEAAALAQGFGTIDAALSNAGTLLATGGALEITGAVTGAGEIDIAAGVQLTLDDADSQVLRFAGAGGTLVLATPGSVTGAIIGLALGDTLSLRGVSATAASASFDSLSGFSTLAVALAGGGTVDLMLAGDYSGAIFGVTQAGADSEITATGTASVTLDPAGPLDFGDLHLGASATRGIAVANNASPGVALDGQVGALTGDGTASGGVSLLAAGGTAADAFTVGLATGAAGMRGGSVRLDFTSDVGGAVAPLPSQSIAVSGTVWRLAHADVTAQDSIVHVGDAGSTALAISNLAVADGYSESLAATVLGASGGITVGGGTPGLIAPGGSDNSTLGFNYSTATAGTVSGSVTLDLASIATGADTLGTTSLGTLALPVSLSVNNYAVPHFEERSGPGILTLGAGGNTLDLGTIALGSGPLTIGLGVLNAASGPADVLAGSLSASGAAAFSFAGLAGFAGLGAGQDDTAPVVTLDTSVAGVVTATVTLTSTGSNASGYSGAFAAQTLTLTADVEPVAGPVLAAPGTLQSYYQMPALLTGLNLSDAGAGSEPLTVVIHDASGSLSAQAAGAAGVTGIGTATLTLRGSLADLNATLASLAYYSSSVGTDSISFAVTDTHNASTSATIAVTTDIVPVTRPVFNGPAGNLLVPGSPTGVGGISVADPYAEATGQPVTVVFSTAVGTLEVTGDYGGTIIGQGTGTLAITGTVQQINAYLGDGLLETMGETIAAGAFDAAVNHTIGFIKTGTIDLLPNEDQIIALGGGPEGKFFELGATAVSFALYAVIGALPGGTPPSQAGLNDAIAQIIGDPHILAPNGEIYDFNAVGEFVLATSTQSGDDFDVQVRLQAYKGSPYATAMTQIAAAVGTDRVSFDTTRPDTVWINGAAATLGATPTMLAGGEVEQIAANSWRVTWNTGEVLTVVDSGDFLGASVAPGPNNHAGTLVGLATLADSGADGFQLPDGSILSAPLDDTTMYGLFADAWRVPQAYSLLDYGPGQTTADFTDTSLPAGTIELSDLPASVVAAARAVVAAAGITDAGAADAAAFDYIVSGGDAGIVAADASLLAGETTGDARATRTGPAPLAVGVLAQQPRVIGDNAAITTVRFTLYLTAASASDTVVDYTVVAATGALDAAAFGGTLPSGRVTIAAGATTAELDIAIPAGGLGLIASQDLAVQISPEGGVPVLASAARSTVVQPIPGTPPVPVLTDQTNLGTFSHVGNQYTLDLGEMQYGAALPVLHFAIANAAAAPSDDLSGSFTADPVEGFTVDGASLPGPITAGQTYQGLTATINTVKFGANSQVITFTPEETNVTGYSATLAPITLTIKDTVVPPTMVFSQAWGDVHIVTYNGLDYNFQAVGEFTLAKSRVAGDSFDIQLRLQQWYSGAQVTVITEVAASVGSDRVTFDMTRPDQVWVDGAAVTLDQARPQIALDGGTLDWVENNEWEVHWTTGEFMRVTNAGPYINVYDGIPLGTPNTVGGLQGEDAGQANDFQLSDGTVLAQPLADSTLYGPYADSWRVSDSASLFDYGPGQSTATFTDRGFPGDVVTLADLPAPQVAAARQMAIDAGITDPTLIDNAALDYLATGDPSFIDSGATAQSYITTTTPVTSVADLPSAPALGVMASLAQVTEATAAPTDIGFEVYLTEAAATDTVVNYSVVAAGTGYFDAASFGGTLPNGSITLDAGSTVATVNITLPQDALGSLASEALQLAISSPGGTVVFAPLATAQVVNNTPQPGTPPALSLAELSGQGTLSHIGNSYTLDLGTLLQGQALTALHFALSNTAMAPADALGGSFTSPVGNGFTIIGTHLPAPIAAGQRYTAIYAGVKTDTLGAHSETLSFNPTDVNASGYSGALDAITLTITDTIAAAADAVLNTPGSIVFGNRRMGDLASQPISISNTAATGAAALDVTASTSGDVVTSGSVSGLAAGQTDATSLSLALDTSAAGLRSGVVTLAPLSIGESPLALAEAPQIDVFGTVYRQAVTVVAPIALVVHVGDPGVAALSVANSAAADGYSEDLVASLAAASGGLSVAPGSGTARIHASDSDTVALVLGFSTATAGTIAGTATLSLASDGGAGADSIDGLGIQALAPATAAVSVAVDNYAAASLTGDPRLTQVDATHYTLDLGSTAQGAGALTASLAALNSAIGQADWLNGSYMLGGDAAFNNSGFAAFSGVSAGNQGGAGSISLATDTAGSFSETVTLDPTGANAGGYAAALAPEVLTVTGTITPTGTAWGDVHMVTFDGLHYDFQATGDFLLAQSTQAGNSFLIQIHADPLPSLGAVSVTTQIAARLGTDRITFDPTRPDLVLLNGVADPLAIGASQTLGGGTLAHSSDGSYRMEWLTGESLMVSDQGSSLDLSAALGPQDGPGSVRGLLGSNAGQATDLQLADGTVLPVPVDDSDLLGAFADAWRVSRTALLLDQATPPPPPAGAALNDTAWQAPAIPMPLAYA